MPYGSLTFSRKVRVSPGKQKKKTKKKEKVLIQWFVQKMFFYRRGSGVWKIPPIIGHADNRIRTFSKRDARFDHVGQGQPLPVDHERG